MSGGAAFSIHGSALTGNSAQIAALISAEMDTGSPPSLVADSTLTLNTAASELAMGLSYSSLTLQNVTYSDNYGATMFAGIRAEASSLSIVNSSFSYSEQFYASCVSSGSALEAGFILA